MDIGTLYNGIKLVHMSCAGASVSLFTARGLWVNVARRGLWRWLRIVPHVIDTLLLASGLTLAFLIHQYPFFNSDWLTAKVIGLIAYIALGTVVFRGPSDRRWRALAGVLALLVFAYIVGVAVTMRPTGFLHFAL
ncbi:SirB2 family protein [Salinisphaera sp.]|uniref:SirB2 family protein n=1 Tax=Salinisphaera sp. TaxID=1914330 RepID=UPI002D7853E4|nr:SirB2 family protein [Salinisphaera sp.]HET7314282.1 SirB2 family protein [Salinisphaera sp.]